VAATTVGYLPWVGTGWFVTLILQLVILFPFLHLAVDRLGGTPCVLAAAGVFLLSYYFIYDVISLMRILLLDTPPSGGLFYYYPFWIFAPARLLPVVAGIMVARHQHVLRWKYAMVAVLLVAIVIAVLTHAPVSPHWGACLSDAMAIPLTLLLLVLISGVGVWGPVASALAWCGRSSWGIYLGQMIVHNGFHIFGHRLETSAMANRWVYFVCLFVGAVGFVTIGNAIRQIPRNDWIPKRR